MSCSFRPPTRLRRWRGVLALASVVAIAALRPAPAVIAEEGGGTDEIPEVLVAHYHHAAQACAGLPWQVVAAIGWVESRHAYGRIDPVSGATEVRIEGPALDGRNGTMAIPDPSFPSGWMHALGPMQFLPTTWQAWATLGDDRPSDAEPSPHNAFDAIASAGAYLCGGEEQIDDLREAILRYNHDDDYVEAVLAKARRYGWDGDTTVGMPFRLEAPGREDASEPPLEGSPTAPSSLACPVDGPVELHDDFGEERAGGVHHQGNDLSTAPGTLLVAPESGVIAWATDGQRAIRTASGAVWLLIHNSYAGDDPAVPATGTPVTAGTPIARVGTSSFGTGLVHLELRPDGQTAHDAYPILVRLCAAADN